MSIDSAFPYTFDDDDEPNQLQDDDLLNLPSYDSDDDNSNNNQDQNHHANDPIPNNKNKTDDDDLKMMEQNKPTTNHSNPKKRPFQPMQYDHEPSNKKQKTFHNNLSSNNFNSNATSSKWVCPLCTFQNYSNIATCHICDALNPKTQTNNNNNNHDDIKIDYNDTSISSLISNFNAVRLKNDDSMDNLAEKLKQLNVINDKIGSGSKTLPSKTNKIGSKLSNIIKQLSNLNVNDGDDGDRDTKINSMVVSLTEDINKHIIELQESLYLNSKMNAVQKSFNKIQNLNKKSAQRMVNILTFYNGNYSNIGELIKFMNDTESDYKYFRNDFRNIIVNNTCINFNNSHSITMNNEFSLIRDFIFQNISECNIDKCEIFTKYICDTDEDDDITNNNNIKYFINTMNKIHSFIFHSVNCGIIVNKSNLCVNGKWYWLMDDNKDIKWVPYRNDDQLLLNNAWKNKQKQVQIANYKYTVKFNNNNNKCNPSGTQQQNLSSFNNNNNNFNGNDYRKRPIIYGVPINDNGVYLLNGVSCEKYPK